MIQSISSGTEVEEKTSVGIVISKGSENGTDGEGLEGTPDGTADGEGTADANLVTKSYFIPLNFASQKETVRVEMIQDGVSKTVYEKEHDKSEDRVQVSVQGAGTATLNIYFGTLKVKSMEVVFE
jgi:hypothetical protein